MSMTAILDITLSGRSHTATKMDARRSRFVKWLKRDYERKKAELGLLLMEPERNSKVMGRLREVIFLAELFGDTDSVELFRPYLDRRAGEG